MTTPEAQHSVSYTVTDVQYKDNNLASYVSALETASQEKPKLKNVLILSQGTLMPVYQQGVEGYPIALEIWGARVGKVYNAAEKTSNFYQVTWKGTEQVVSYTLTKPTKVDLTTDGKVLTDADYGYHLVDGAGVDSSSRA